MNIAYACQNFVDALDQATGEVDYARAANRLAEVLGFRWFTYLSLADTGAAPEAMSTYPAVWSEHYFANSYEHIDPVIAVSRMASEPFFWGGLDPNPADAPQDGRLFEDAASFGITSGLTIPLRGPKGRTALFTLSTDESSKALLEQALGIKVTAQLCALHLHNQLSSRIGRFMPSHHSRRLTNRQRACLAAAADGQSAKQAARLIGLTPRTVQHHVDEAKRRLDAVSLAHAVALAIKGGLLRD